MPTRRAGGLSVGLNLNPDKVCNFDCPYCQVDRTTPGGPADIDVPLRLAELGDLLARVADGTLWSLSPFDTAAPAHRRVVDIAFAGDGEPTSPSAFPEVAREVRALRDSFGLTVPVRLLTNSTLLHRDHVRAGLPFIDEVWCKLDAGTEPYFRAVDGTTFPYSRILRNLRETALLRPIVVQSMFQSLDGEAPSAAERDAWAARLGEIVAAGGVIDRVQVYTVARRPSSDRVQKLPNAELEDIAERVRSLGITVEVHGAG